MAVVQGVAPKQEQAPLFFADGFYGTGLKGHLALLFFLRARGLLEHERVAMLIISGEVIRSFGPTGIAVDALVIHIKLTGLIVGPFFRDVSHTTLV